VGLASGSRTDHAWGVTFEVWLGFTAVAVVPWVFLLLAAALARRERQETAAGQTRVIVGHATVVPGLVAVWLMVGPVMGFVGMSQWLEWSASNAVAPVMAAVLLLVVAVGLGYVSLRVLPRLLLTRRIVLDDDKLELRWWWRKAPRFSLRWAQPHRHEVYRETEERKRKDGGTYELYYENHRFEQDGEALWLRMAEGEPKLNAVDLPESAPRWRPTLEMGRERGRFLHDPRIVKRRKAWIPLDEEPSPHVAPPTAP